MSTWFGKMLATIIAVSAAVYVVVKISPPISISSIVSQKDSLFTVSGEGKVTVVPDIGIVNLGISISRSTVKDTQTEANRVINAISAEVKKMGVDSKDIQTSNYNIYPQYDYRNTTNRITGYQITSTLTITVRDLDKLNSVIDVATANGANTVSGVSLTVNDERLKELNLQAREKAVAEAKIKAESLAKAAGISLGRIINVQESSPSYPRPMLYATDLKAGLGGGSETNIQPGSTDIVSSITLSYETR
jgi:uncharacterized protein YggE